MEIVSVIIPVKLHNTWLLHLQDYESQRKNQADHFGANRSVT